MVVLDCSTTVGFSQTVMKKKKFLTVSTFPLFFSDGVTKLDRAVQLPLLELR